MALFEPSISLMMMVILVSKVKNPVVLLLVSMRVPQFVPLIVWRVDCIKSQGSMMPCLVSLLKLGIFISFLLKLRFVVFYWFALHMAADIPLL